FLVCHHEEVQARAVEALVAAVRRGRVPEARIAEAGRRIDRLVARFVRPPVDAEALAVLGCDAHRRALAPLAPHVSLPPTATHHTAPSPSRPSPALRLLALRPPNQHPAAPSLQRPTRFGGYAGLLGTVDRRAHLRRGARMRTEREKMLAGEPYDPMD